MDLNVRANTTKPFLENTGVNLLDLGLGGDFLDITSKAQAMKKKTDIKIKTYRASKDTIQEVKRQTKE